MTPDEAIRLTVTLREYLPVINDAQGELIVRLLLPMSWEHGERLIPRFAIQCHTQEFSVARLREFLRGQGAGAIAATERFLAQQAQREQQAARTWPTLIAWWDALPPAERDELYGATLDLIPRSMRRGYTPEVARTRLTFLARAQVLWRERQSATEGVR